MGFYRSYILLLELPFLCTLVSFSCRILRSYTLLSQITSMFPGLRLIWIIQFVRGKRAVYHHDKCIMLNVWLLTVLKTRGRRPESIYHMSNISIYLGRQREVKPSTKESMFCSSFCIFYSSFFILNNDERQLFETLSTWVNTSREGFKIILWVGPSIYMYLSKHWCNKKLIGFSPSIFACS